MKHFLFYGLFLTLLFTISFTLVSEPVFAQMNTYMSPKHQMQSMNDLANVVCQQGMVLMMKNTTGYPVCVSPSSYWRLADRSWGVFDTDLLNQNQNHMHGVMGAMINHPQMSQHMHDWMMNNPQHMQTMMDNWMPQMMQNDQWMMNMMGPIMNDSELRQQMMNHMMMNPQMMDTMKSNQQWMGMMHGQPMMGDAMYHGMMMNGTMNCPWCPFMQESMNQSMIGMGCAWCQGHMGQGMMMNKGMMGQQTQSSMKAGPTPSQGWMMNNPQHMQTMMNHMMNHPQSMQEMHEMMMQNPQHMYGMMNNMMVPMMNHMMNNPQMQQQMMNHMMNHPQMMQQWMQNQQYFDSKNGDVSDKTETSVNSQNAQVSIALGSASPGCEKTNECYLPYSITISEHSSVTWTNDDLAVHTVTSGIPSEGPNGIFDSGAISPGATFTNQFDEEGTFDYYCIAHPWMTGKIVVEMMEDKMEDTMEDKMKDTMEDKMEDTTEAMIVGGIDVSMSAPLEGSFDAPITIIEFGDFQCPKCNIWFQGEKPTIVENYIDTGIAKVYFVDYTWLGDDSSSAAQAAHCAGDQEMYWEYHAHLYNNQGGINDGWASPNNLKGFAHEMGLDSETFDECLDSGKYRDRVSHNNSVGFFHEVEGTPTFFIIDSDGTVERINGPQPASVFDKVMESFS